MEDSWGSSSSPGMETNSNSNLIQRSCSSRALLHAEPRPREIYYEFRYCNFMEILLEPNDTVSRKVVHRIFRRQDTPPATGPRKKNKNCWRNLCDTVVWKLWTRCSSYSSYLIKASLVIWCKERQGSHRVLLLVHNRFTGLWSLTVGK